MISIGVHGGMTRIDTRIRLPLLLPLLLPANSLKILFSRLIAPVVLVHLRRQSASFPQFSSSRRN